MSDYDGAIPFNRPQVVGRELDYIAHAVGEGFLSGGGEYGGRCATWLEQRTGCVRALMTPSCTSALEMAARLVGVGPGDEVIMPSFTFVSTATSVVRAGGTPVFVDIDPVTLNIDPDAAAAAVTPSTRAIAVVHYAGRACDMDQVRAIADRAGAHVMEDAAHAILATWKGRPLGGLGSLGAISFHETKNVQCGEGGALLINDPELVAAAEVMQRKGTNRAQFNRGEVDRYTWVGEGSNFVMSELSAAFLWAQLEHADDITARRMAVWTRYWEAFGALEERGLVRRPHPDPEHRHNGHIFELLTNSRGERDALIERLADRGISAVFHYVPLHSSPAGRRYGRTAGELVVTDDIAGRLVRLPLWAGMCEREVTRVIEAVHASLGAPIAAV